MRILVYGAGVIGSLYAARLKETGAEVTVLARGKRLEAIREHGIELEDVSTGKQTSARVATIDTLLSETQFDLVVVPVRNDQLDSVLPTLAASRGTPSVLFFGNDARGPAAQISALGRNRVLLGFPGAGGRIEGRLVRYLLIPQQRTTVGDLDGGRSARITEIARVLRSAGFPVAVSRDMGSWLTTHAAFVTCIAAAVYIAGGDADRLASEADVLRLMVRATREAFGALRAIGVRELPTNLRLLYGLMPSAFAVRYWRRALATPLGAFSLAAHANAARSEMTVLAQQVTNRLRGSPRPTPALEQLFDQAGLLPGPF
jgi:2-dehydropantoate 2-reductase